MTKHAGTMGSPLRLAQRSARPGDDQPERPLGRQGHRARGGGDSALPLPLVGRTAEREVLAAIIEMAATGVAGAVVIRGPEGAGKTRLAQEAVAIARASGFACAWGAGFADGGLPPMWPWQSVMAQLGHEVEMSEPGHEPGHEPVARFEQFRAVVDQLARTTATSPTLLVLDDAHAIDAGALLLVRFVIRSLRASRLVVLITASDEDIDESVLGIIDDIARDGRTLRPAPLTPDGVQQLLRSVGSYGDEAQLGEIVEATAGSPLLVHELLMARADIGEVGTISMQAICDLRVRGLDVVQRRTLAAISLLGQATVPAWIAAVAGVPVASVADVIEEATASGLASARSGDVKVRHELIARTILASFSSAEVAAMHDRAADCLAGAEAAQTVERMTAVARHRITSATLLREPDHLDRAAAAVRAASTRLLRSLAFETASEMTKQVVALYDDSGLSAPVGLVLDAARSELAAGRLVEARRWFARAANLAPDGADRAVAALGLGGIWVREHRSASDHAQFVDLLERALGGLAPDDHALAVRLRVRLAAESVYSRTGTRDDVVAAVDEARRLGDPYVLAESLSLLLHTMLGPALAGGRRAVTDEMTRAAAASGDGLMVLLAAMWRAIDLVLCGDERSERALNELREQADALQVAAVLFVVKSLDVMRLIRDGRMTEALHGAEECFELGHRLGDADAVAYLGAHLLTIRWLQQRSDEMLPLARQMAGAPTLIDGDMSYPAAIAVLTAMTGRTDEAAVTLHRVFHRSAGPERQHVEFSSTWMVSMFLAGEAARLLGDAEAAAVVYDALLPYAALPIMASLGVVCVGSAERSLGIAAQTMGRLDLAVEHLERGLAHNHRLGNRVMVAITQGELGEALLDRCAGDDPIRGRHLVNGAIAALRELGLVERAAMLEVGLAGRAAAADEPVGQVVQRGAVWELRYGDQTIRLEDTVGAQRLIHLLEHPFVDVPAADLVGGVAPGAVQEMVDSKALRAYHDRVIELRHDIDEAEADCNLARAERLRDELDAILSHLSSSEALFGRSRRFVTAHERARIAVRKSLTRVLDEVSAQSPQFAVALTDSLRTGSMCRFHPQTPFPATWQRVTASPPDSA